jgi:hypothetical protein
LASWRRARTVCARPVSASAELCTGGNGKATVSQEITRISASILVSRMLALSSIGTERTPHNTTQLTWRNSAVFSITRAAKFRAAESSAPASGGQSQDLPFRRYEDR